MNVIKYFLKYGKKIKPIRQNIWDLVAGLIMKDKSDLILFMSDVVLLLKVREIQK